MIKVSVMYPNTPGARFDHDYYRDRHLPLIKSRMGAAAPQALQEQRLQRLRDRERRLFADWDMRDGKADWTPEALAANANVFLDDFLLFDVAKPITDESHLEIEKSTIDGRPYQTGEVARSTRTRSTSCSPGSSTTIASSCRAARPVRRSPA